MRVALSVMTKPNASHNHDVVDALLDEARAITTAANRLDTAAIDRALSILVGTFNSVLMMFALALDAKKTQLEGSTN